MDPVVALAAMSAVLQASRIRKIDAKLSADHIAPGAMSGGFLAADTNVKLGVSQDGSDVISSITVRIEGFPKGITKEKAVINTGIFCIEVTAQGIYTWVKNSPPPDVMGHPNLAHALGRPIYALAASEVISIAVKMGFTGVTIDPDIPPPKSAVAGNTPSIDLKKKTSIAQKLTKKAPTAKKTKT